MSRPRVVVAGLGDTGLLTAIHLSRHADVVGISAKPGLVSGQELGMRLTRPDEWARDYWVSFDRYRRMDRVRTVHATLTGLDPDERVVHIGRPDGTPATEPYDALVIATGVSNGFWRRPGLLTHDQVATALAADHERLGVGLHPRHRAVVPAGFGCDEITDAPVAWSTGQPESKASAVLWTIGRVRPNTAWLPRALLDENGFVPVDEYLRVPGVPGVYAIGDVAATDPLRTSARSRADGLLAHNIRADLTVGTAAPFRPATRRWGSVVGPQHDNLEFFTPNGRAFRIPAWSRLQPFIVERGIYGGIVSTAHSCHRRTKVSWEFVTGDRRHLSPETEPSCHQIGLGIADAPR